MSKVSHKLQYGIGASSIQFDGVNRYIRITDISNWKDNEFTSPSFIEESSLLKENDILLARTGATVGESFIYKDDGIKSYFAGFLIRARIEKANPFFIYYQLKTPRYKQWIKISSARSGQPGINSEQYGAYLIGIAEKNEQDKISSFFKKIDKRIDTQNKIIEDLFALRNTIKEELSKPKKTFLKIKDILSEVSIKSKIQNQYPILSSTVKGLFLQSEYFDRQVASENNIGYKIVELGDIIISPQNLWMGNITLNNKFEIGIVSPSYKIYKVRDGYNTTLVFNKLTTQRSFYNYALVSEQGASIVRRNLNIDSFEQLLIPFDIRTDMKILNAIISINTKLDNEKAILKYLIKQKKYLLSNLFI